MISTRSNRLSVLIQSNLRMVVNAASLVGTMGLNAGLGFAFWWVAARYYTQMEIGIASASLSAMLVLGELCVLGLTTYLIGEVPRRKESAPSLIFTAAVITFFVALAAGVLFAVIASRLTEDLNVLSAGIGNILLFAFGVSLTSNALVVDHAMVGLNRGEYQLWRNLLFAVLKLIFIVVVALIFQNHTALDIYGAWALSGVVSLLIVPAIAFYRGLKFEELRFDRSMLKGLRGDILSHHGLNLAVLGPSLFIPTLAGILISAESAANFYMAWMLTSVILVVPYALSTSLYGAASENITTFVMRMRVSLSISVAVGAVASVALWFLAAPILGLFGDVYAEEATVLLQLRAFGIFPFILIVHYAAIMRISQKNVRAALVLGIGAVMQLAFMIIGSRMGGAVSLALGYLAAITISAIITLPVVYKAAMGLWKLPESITSKSA